MNHWALFAIGLISLLTSSQSMAQPEMHPYVDFRIGGSFPVSGDVYDSVDAGFQIQMEAGGQYFAFPVSFGLTSLSSSSTFVTGPSFDFITISAKPRLQYFFAPFPNSPKLFLAPGFGFVFNYWQDNESSFNLKMIELGVQPSVLLRYCATDRLHFDFVPLSLDFNFWRNAWTPSVSNSNSDLGIVYNLLFGLGYSF